MVDTSRRGRFSSAMIRSRSSAGSGLLHSILAARVLRLTWADGRPTSALNGRRAGAASDYPGRCAELSTQLLPISSVYAGASNLMRDGEEPAAVLGLLLVRGADQPHRPLADRAVPVGDHDNDHQELLRVGPEAVLLGSQSACAAASEAVQVATGGSCQFAKEGPKPANQ